MISDPPKILLLYAHPEAQDSVANQVLLKAAASLSHVTVHDLYAHYPDFFIDIPHEQRLLRDHQVIVFQHPLYTYSCPALLKEWLDRVLTRGFASGISGDALAGKHWRSVITTGDAKSAYQTSGTLGVEMANILRPFVLTAALCRMHWQPPMIIYWARRQGAARLACSASEYVRWLSLPLSSGREGERYGYRE